MKLEDTKIAVIGLGYVGLPLAVALAKKFPVVGFDTDIRKVKGIASGLDPNKEGYDEEIKSSNIKVTGDEREMQGCNFFIVGVPTPVDENKNPDLKALDKASRTVGRVLPRGGIVVFESTVYPGVTEEYCGHIIEEVSGLTRGKDFFLGYSPERINPGDKEHSVERVIKVISAENDEALEIVASVYGSVVKAGVHKAPSIKVAEAAKVIENTQRDLNIALMNELAIIFDRIGISTRDVLEAAGTKWNFLKFSPGLVGGHCIGVDPYYLTAKAEALGYHPQVILAGRRINDDMGTWIAQRVVKLLIHGGFQPKGSKVAILGMTFKENVADCRNSRVIDVYRELKEFGIVPVVHDPHADPHETKEEYGITLSKWDDIGECEGVILAVAHKEYLRSIDKVTLLLKKGGVLADVKSALNKKEIPQGLKYWSL